jgi:hypothetical protein
MSSSLFPVLGNGAYSEIKEKHQLIIKKNILWEQFQNPTEKSENKA